MNQNMRRYKKRMLILCMMLAVVLMITGVSYAIFTSYSSQSDANNLAASCMDLEFNGQNEINLLNTYPISEGEALEQTPYTFTIKNNCDNYIEYYVIASVISTTNKVDSKYVKVSLLGDHDLNGAVINSLESIATPQSLSKYSISENYILKRGDGIIKDESRTFNFRMWLDSNNPDIWTSEDVEGKDYQVKISVVGTVRTRPKDDLFVAALIDGEESTSFPTTDKYTATVECTRNGKKIDANESIKWNGTKWVLTTAITDGNVRCNATFTTQTFKDAILANNEVKAPLTTPGKEVSAYTKDDLLVTENENIDSKYQSYYFTYGTDYEANGTDFNLTGATVTSSTFSSSYSELVGKYLLATNYFNVRDFSNPTKTLDTTTNRNKLYYVVSTTSSSITYKDINSNKKVTESLIATTEDDYGTSYYFRGKVKNNYVQFANKCWRIVRITGDGSVKLVLYNDNISNVNKPCSSSNSSTTAAFAKFSGNTSTTQFNTTNRTDNTSVGFMHGIENATDYASAHANTNKSTILTNLETWYKNNLESFETKLADVIWCNDKSGGSYGEEPADYGATLRSNTPSLICPNDNNGGKLSKFTVDDTTNGNGNLTYKIGLLTVDEVVYAGHYNFYSSTSATYLQENAIGSWWTLSPASYDDDGGGLTSNIHNVVSDGAVYGSSSAYTSNLRPAIALISTTKVTGSGTSEDPYVVNS